MSYYRSRDLKTHSTNDYPFNEYNKIQENFQQSFNTNSPQFQQSFNTNSQHEKNNIEYFQQNFHQNVSQKIEKEDDNKTVIIYENKLLNGVNPLIWGPSFWFLRESG